MKLINDINLHPVIFRALQKDGYNPGKSDFTVTSLIKPPRIRELEKRHSANLIIPASKRKGAFFGTVIHKILELGEAKNTIRERRLYSEIDGKIISAQFDCLTLDDAKLTDWKSMVCSTFKMDKTETYEQQVNTQAWLLANGYDENGTRVAYQVETIEAVALLLDWQVSKAKVDSKYPQSWSLSIPLQLWPMAKTEAWIRERVKLHTAAETLADNALPECSREERWQRESIWAVMKEGRKTALPGGLHASHASAQAFIKELKAGPYYIQERPAESIRCEEWCAVKTLCNQYAASLPAGVDESVF